MPAPTPAPEVAATPAPTTITQDQAKHAYKSARDQYRHGDWIEARKNFVTARDGGYKPGLFEDSADKYLARMDEKEQADAAKAASQLAAAQAAAAAAAVAAATPAPAPAPAPIPACPGGCRNAGASPAPAPAPEVAATPAPAPAPMPAPPRPLRLRLKLPRLLTSHNCASHGLASHC